MKKIRFPWSRKRRSRENQARVRQEAKDRYKRVRSNGHTPQGGKP